MIITVDGPSGTGKTTVAKRLAHELGYAHYDTGAMYRAVTYGLMHAGIDVDDVPAIHLYFDNFDYQVKNGNGTPRFWIGDEDVTEVIRTPEVTARVSEVSAKPVVRDHLVALQRKYAEDTVDAVFEGRDMGTVVFPDAQMKVYLTASSEVRAKRRLGDLTAVATPEKPAPSFSEVLEAINKRDTYDSSRKMSPLRPADDAHIVDTTNLTLEEVVAAIVALLPT